MVTIVLLALSGAGLIAQEVLVIAYGLMNAWIRDRSKENEQ